MLNGLLHGLLHLSFWGYVLATLILTQITIAAITIYLHRHQAHRALELHPIMSHFFRFWLWLTTGMVTREWVAIHRKHHAKTETADDPHSPMTFGISKILWEGAEAYRKEAKNTETIEKYSHGTPDDWIDRALYRRFKRAGLVLMLFSDLLLFGIPGISIWAIQMLWTPLFAAGVINGIGHYWGYRNYETPDTSTNILPIAFFIGGEELHNNHHTYASSAKFSIKPWEYDIGWMYIKLMSYVGLARVKTLPPQLDIVKGKLAVDLDTVKALIANRFLIMARYYQQVMLPVLRDERSKHTPDETDLLKNTRHLLKQDDTFMSLPAKKQLSLILEKFQPIDLVYQYRLNLQNIWRQAASSQHDLMAALHDWCKQAENSGLEVLKQFSQQLRTLAPKIAAQR